MLEVIGFKNPSEDFPAYVIPVVLKQGRPVMVFQTSESDRSIVFKNFERDYWGNPETWNEILMPRLDLANGFLFAHARHTVSYIRNQDEASFIKLLLKKKQLHKCQIPGYKKRLRVLKALSSN